jgi:hypothetical protein
MKKTDLRRHIHDNGRSRRFVGHKAQKYESQGVINSIYQRDTYMKQTHNLASTIIIIFIEDLEEKKRIVQMHDSAMARCHTRWLSGRRPNAQGLNPFFRDAPFS